jgi:CRP-like cAMP-binding protein
VNHSENKLLAILSSQVFAELQPHLKVREFEQGVVLAENGGPVTEVYFPYSGIVSLVVELKEGDMVEAAMVGRDGVINAASALDGRVSLNKAIVQMRGFLAAVSVPIVVAVADQHRDLRALFIRHEQVLLAQSQQSGACNASHMTETRLCRWLLRTRDLAQSDDLHITQEFLGQMLGVQRTSISIVAGALQRAGLIRYQRGHIKILDVDGLKEGACECYETVKAHYDQMLTPPVNCQGSRADDLPA